MPSPPETPGPSTPTAQVNKPQQPPVPAGLRDTTTGLWVELIMVTGQSDQEGLWPQSLSSSHEASLSLTGPAAIAPTCWGIPKMRLPKMMGPHQPLLPPLGTPMDDSGEEGELRRKRRDREEGQAPRMLLSLAWLFTDHCHIFCSFI